MLSVDDRLLAKFSSDDELNEQEELIESNSTIDPFFQLNFDQATKKTSLFVVLTEEWITEKKKTNHKIRNVQTKVQRHLVLEDGKFRFKVTSS